MQSLKPLPEELRDTDATDNSCSFCGVSYLILHEVERLRLRIAELEVENASLQRVKNNAQSSQMNTLSSMDALTNLTEAFKARADEATEERDRMLARAKKLEHRNEVLMMCIRRLQAGLDALRVEVTTLREALESIKCVDPTVIPGMMDTLHRLILSLEQAYNEQFEASELEGKRLRVCLSAAQEDLAALKLAMDNKISLLTSTLNEANTHNENLNLELRELRETISLLNDTIATLEGQIASMSTEIDKLKLELQLKIEQFNDINAGEKEHLQRIELLTLELKNKNEELANLLLQLKSSKDDAQILKANLTTLENEFTSLRETCHSEVNKYQEIIRDLNKRLTEAIEQLQQLEEETDTKQAALQKELGSINMALIAEKAESSAANQMCDKLKAEQKSLLDSNRALSNELEKLRDAFQSSNKTRSSTEEALQQKIWDLQRENTLLENQILEVEEKNARLCKEREQKEKLICDMDIKLQDMKVQIAELEAQLAEKVQQVAELQANTSSTEIFEEAKKHISDLESKIKVLQQTIFNECQERSNLLHTLTTLKAQNAELLLKIDNESSTLALPQFPQRNSGVQRSRRQ